MGGMGGIRKRISIGFISLALLLFFSGAISVSELNRTRSAASEIIEADANNMELSKRMLMALQMQNGSVLKMIALNGTAPDADYAEGINAFNSALLDATNTVADRFDLDEIYHANDLYHTAIQERINTQKDTDGGEDAEKWLYESYLKVYYALDMAITDYMTTPQGSLGTRTALFEKNFYRTITPSILTLCVAMLIVLMFYFFMDLYYVQPILKVNKGLKQYIESRVPFTVEVEQSGEITTLKENIEKLIAMIKGSK